MRRKMLDFEDWYDRWCDKLAEDYGEEYPGSYDDLPSVHEDGMSNADHYVQWVDEQWKSYLESLGDV